MPGGRRNLSRSGSGRPPPSIYATHDDINKSKLGLQYDGKVVSPRHMPLPLLPNDSNLMFEFIMFVFTVMATFLQFLHLYRSVWWLPHSYTNYTMNFYLIDLHLVVFVVLMLARRLLFSVISQVIVYCAPVSLWPVLQQSVRFMLLGILLCSFIWCIWNVMPDHPIWTISSLSYPIGIYLYFFRLGLSPLFDVMSLAPSTTEECKSSIRILEQPSHDCSMSPQSIREEVDFLKNDFNGRLRQVLFSSGANAYYSGFLPCAFAPHFLIYDSIWAIQHLIFVWLGCLTMYLSYCYPVRYLDTLHRAALHLGKWGKIEGRSMHLPSHIWLDSSLWHHGALVKHNKELFKAEGMSIAAEPGNASHARFYMLFSNPAVAQCTVVGVQLCLVGLQVAVLVRVSEWYQVVSLALLIFANFYTLFKLARDYLVCWHVYKFEATMQDNIAGG